MSLENGNKISDYNDLANCLEKYKEDNKIFEKAMILLNLYTSKPSWPHSFEEYQKDAIDILGGDPYFIGRIGTQLKDHLDNEENSDIDKNFKLDLTFFALNTYMTLDNAYYSRMSPFELDTISSTINETNGKIIIKFSRNDNSSLQMEMSENDIQSIIDYLENLIRKG